MDIQGLLGEVLQGNNLSAISQSIGADEGTTSQAIQTVLPMILGGLAKNSSTAEGAGALAGALDKDHDGSILGDIAGYVLNGQGSSVGASILGHIFGGNTNAVQQGVSQNTGLDAATVGKLMITLAPIVMGYLGRAKQQQGLDPQGLADALGQQHQQMSQSSPLMGMLTSILDSNHDGSIVDDALRIAGGFLNRR